MIRTITIGTLILLCAQAVSGADAVSVMATRDTAIIVAPTNLFGANSNSIDAALNLTPRLNALYPSNNPSGFITGSATNAIKTTTDDLQAQIMALQSGPTNGVTAATVTNIAAYQSLIATQAIGPLVIAKQQGSANSTNWAQITTNILSAIAAKALQMPFSTTNLTSGINLSLWQRNSAGSDGVQHPYKRAIYFDFNLYGEGDVHATRFYGDGSTMDNIPTLAAVTNAASYVTEEYVLANLGSAAWEETSSFALRSFNGIVAALGYTPQTNGAFVTTSDFSTTASWLTNHADVALAPYEYDQGTTNHLISWDPYSKTWWETDVTMLNDGVWRGLFGGDGQWLTNIQMSGVSGLGTALGAKAATTVTDSLQAQINALAGGPTNGVTAATVTNIAAYQSLIATQGLMGFTLSASQITNTAAYQAFIATQALSGTITSPSGITNIASYQAQLATNMLYSTLNLRKQHGSVNLTNWSALDTNLLITPSVVTNIAAALDSTNTAAIAAKAGTNGPTLYNTALKGTTTSLAMSMFGSIGRAGYWNMDVFGVGWAQSLSASNFFGNGAGLTDITGANVSGTVASATVAGTARELADFAVHIYGDVVGDFYTLPGTPTWGISSAGEFQGSAGGLTNFPYSSITNGLGFLPLSTAFRPDDDWLTLNTSSDFADVLVRESDGTLAWAVLSDVRDGVGSVIGSANIYVSAAGTAYTVTLTNNISGSLGIGRTPGKTLDVEGDIRSSGTIWASDDVRAGGAGTGGKFVAGGSDGISPLPFTIYTLNQAKTGYVTNDIIIKGGIITQWTQSQ